MQEGPAPARQTLPVDSCNEKRNEGGACVNTDVDLGYLTAELRCNLAYSDGYQRRKTQETIIIVPTHCLDSGALSKRCNL